MYQNLAKPVSVRSALDSRALAILPISVCIPVLTITTRARPLVTWDPEKTRQIRSLAVSKSYIAGAVECTHPTGQSSSSMASSCLATGRDSPVRNASSHSRLLQCPSMIRPSAGTISPFLRRTISPGTTSSTGIVLVAGEAVSPDRRTTVA